MDDAHLDSVVARVQAGDESAFGDVVFLIRKELRIFLSAHASSIDMVEEVLQATLVACYENVGKYERRGTFLAWAKGIARNLLLKEIAARARYVNAEQDVLERILLEGAAEAMNGSGEREQASVERLRNCLERLPEESRQILTKRYYDRLSIRDLARFLNRSETATAVALFRIRDALRACMMKEAAS